MDLDQTIQRYAVSIVADIVSATPEQITELLDPNTSDFSKDTAFEVSRVDTHLRDLLVELQAESGLETARLKELIHRDETGLSKALGMVRRLLRAYSWIGDPMNWGSYSFEAHTPETLREEFRNCSASIDSLAKKALEVSGQRADAAFHLRPAPAEEPLIPETEVELRLENARLRERLDRATTQIETLVEEMKRGA